MQWEYTIFTSHYFRPLHLQTILLYLKFINTMYMVVFLFKNNVKEKFAQFKICLLTVETIGP